VDLLIDRSDELARRWAAALVLERPVARMAEVPLAALGHDGPRLCAQALRALVSDPELDRLTGAGPATGRERTAPARRLAELAGAAGPTGTIAAAEALRGVLWEALESSLRDVSGRELLLVCDRLAHVCAASAGAAADAAAESSRQDASAAGEGAPADREQAPLLVEEISAPGPAEESSQLRTRAVTSGPPDATSATIQIRDVRGEGAGDSGWAIGRQLERFAVEEEPFTVVLVELMERERIEEPGLDAESERLGEAIQQLLLEELRRPPGEAGWTASRVRGRSAPEAGSLTRERAGRYWLIAAGRDRAAGQELADRIVHAGASMRSSDGRPLALAVGTASCPQDASEAEALAAHADVGLFAARAAFRAAAGSISSDPAA
jgi:hypothetical protein